MTKRRLRAVVDTNVVIAALKARNPNSPTRELLARWENGEFDWLYSDDLRAEYVAKLKEKQVDPSRARVFFARLKQRGYSIPLTKDDLVHRVPADPDDDIVIACAIVGRATHLVTYDPHLHALGEVYQGVRILDGLQFLRVLRGDAQQF